MSDPRPTNPKLIGVCPVCRWRDLRPADRRHTHTATKNGGPR